jgi:hypothetical protein
VTRALDVLDWFDRNRTQLTAAATVTTLAGIGALFVGAVTPEAGNRSRSSPPSRLGQRTAQGW